MKTRTLTILLGLAVFAIPAAVPASQPANVKLMDLNPSTTLSPAVTSDLQALLANPYQMGELSIVLPTTFTTLSAEIDG
jgi:hypothetical protein